MHILPPPSLSQHQHHYHYKAMPLVLPDGLDSLEELLTFLKHPVPDVRAMAAQIALSISASEVRIGGPREDGREGGRMERDEGDQDAWRGSQGREGLGRVAQFVLSVSLQVEGGEGREGGVLWRGRLDLPSTHPFLSIYCSTGRTPWPGGSPSPLHALPVVGRYRQGMCVLQRRREGGEGGKGLLLPSTHR